MVEFYNVIRVVAIVLKAVVLIPAIVFLVLLIRKAGFRQDPARRWISFAVAALGFFSTTYLLDVVSSIIFINNSPDDVISYKDPVVIALGILDTLTLFAQNATQIAVFLALFYLARAFTILRTDETSKRYRIGRLFALGSSAFVSLLALTSAVLLISYYAERQDPDSWSGSDSGHDNVAIRYYVATVFNLACYVVHVLCAVGSMFYVAKTNNNAKNGPMHEASKIALISAILWLIHICWMFISTSLTAFGYFYYENEYSVLLAAFLNTWTTFVVIMLFYTLATKHAYGLSGEKQQPQPK